MVAVCSCKNCGKMHSAAFPVSWHSVYGASHGWAGCFCKLVVSQCLIQNLLRVGWLIISPICRSNLGFRTPGQRFLDQKRSVTLIEWPSSLQTKSEIFSHVQPSKDKTIIINRNIEVHSFLSGTHSFEILSQIVRNAWVHSPFLLVNSSIWSSQTCSDSWAVSGLWVRNPTWFEPWIVRLSLWLMTDKGDRGY